MEIASDKAIYLFCLCPAPSGFLPVVDGNGLDGKNPLFLWRYMDIVAVLSMISIEEFCGPVAESSMKEIAWLGPRACRHEEVIEQVMSYGPVLPARFGILFSSLEKLENLLRESRNAISQFFTQVIDKQEWAVKGLLNRTKARNSFASLLIAEQESELSSLPQGLRYFQEQQIRATVDKELKRWQKDVCGKIIRELNCYASGFHERKILSRDITGKGVDMILNWAFLVPKKDLEAFRARVSDANAEYSDYGLVFELSGPWPPYSFAPPIEREA